MTESTKLSEFFAKGSYSQVITLASSLNVSPESDPQSCHILAASYFLLGEFEKAHYLLKELAPIFEDSAPFLSLHAATCRRLGDLDLAKKLFSKALSIDPESKEIQNNYANLLIDMKDFKASKLILKKILNRYPDYSDAKLNLARLESLEQGLGKNNESIASQSSDNVDDPLLLAFAQEEVDYSYKRYANIQKNNNVHAFPNPDINTVTQEQLELIQKCISANDFKLALNLCSQALSKLGVSPSIYSSASDALLAKESYDKSELLLLHSMLLGGPSFKSFVNLVSFACMRKDFELAKYYLKKAKEIDPTSDTLCSLADQVHKQEMASTNPFSFNSF